MPGDVTLGFIRAVIRAPVSASPGAQLASLQVPYCPSGAITRRPLRTQPRQGRWPAAPTAAEGSGWTQGGSQGGSRHVSRQAKGVLVFPLDWNVRVNPLTCTL